MSDAPTRRFDLEAYFRSTVGIANEGGGRGHERGTRILSACPECGAPGKAWLNASGWVKCFREAVCSLSVGVSGVELVRRTEGFRTRAEAVRFLRREFPSDGLPTAPPSPAASYDDWCRFPREFRQVPRGWNGGGTTSVLLDEARAFASRQWGVTAHDLGRWSCGVCAAGRHAWRLVIPIVMGGNVVAFQSRSFRNGEPKYLTSQYGKQSDPWAECGRPAEALLFNLDAVTEGRDVVLVEGAGDAMAVARGEPRGRPGNAGGEAGRGAGPQQSDQHGRAVAVALLGVACTEEKAALLAARRPGRVTVAMDADAGERSAEIAEVLAMWGLDADVGRWSGGKDAGSGAALTFPFGEVGGRGMAVFLARRMGR